MTTQPNPVLEAPPTEPEPLIVAPKPGSKLDQLHAAYVDAKAEAEAAAARLKTITDGIKLALSEAGPEETRLELRGPSGPPLRLSYVETWRFDSKKLKANAQAAAVAGDSSLAAFYASYAKKGGSWTLKAVSDQGGEE